MKYTLHVLIIFYLFHYTIESKIVFPTTDDFPTDCKLPDGTKGTCRNLQYCPAAITAQKVNMCYFDRNVEYVCCKENIRDCNVTHSLALNNFLKDLRVQIVAGYNTAYKEFGYMVALGWKSIAYPNEIDYKCGGVLISHQYVLTAAHCALLNGMTPEVALIGGTNLTDLRNEPIPIIDIKMYPGYKKNESYHDIALIRLKINATEDPICIWRFYTLDGVNVTTIGYGHTRFGGASSGSLLKAYLLIVSNKDCFKHYMGEPSLPHGIVETQICAKDPDSIRDTCQGDSGGPIILFSMDKLGIIRPFVVGITSFGRACAQEPPGVYTRVSEYTDWIDSIAFKRYV